MHTVSQNKDKFSINNLFYCCEALIFTQPLVYEFLCGLIFMTHPVVIIGGLFCKMCQLLSYYFDNWWKRVSKLTSKYEYKVEDSYETHSNMIA